MCAFWKIHLVFKCGFPFSGLMYIHCDITTIYGADENADEADEENYFIMMMVRF